MAGGWLEEGTALTPRSKVVNYLVLVRPDPGFDQLFDRLRLGKEGGQGPDTPVLPPTMLRLTDGGR